MDRKNKTFDNNITEIQETLIRNLSRLDNTCQEDLKDEVARSNSISQLANTYIKTCNLIIRIEDCENKIKNKVNGINE